jgi:glucosamine--fructose-6-phosphate aminotransferase (isomerizing)
MIAAEPALAGRVLRRMGARLVSGGAPGTGPRPSAPGRDDPAGRLAGSIRRTLEAGGPVVVVGCGTSEHAARAFAEIVTDAARRARLAGADGPGAIVAREAFEAASDPQQGGLIVAVSHEGATAAVLDALRAARANGAHTAAITVSGASPLGQLARHVLATGEVDLSWSHTVGYVSPILAAAAVGAALTGDGRDSDPAAIRSLLAEGAGRGADLPAAAARAAATEAMARRLAGTARLVVVASGADRVAARELALKIEEACWLPAAARDLESFLHGPLAAVDESTAVVLILADRRGREARSARAQQAMAAAARVGAVPGALLAAGLDADWPAFLAPAGRILVPEGDGLPAPVAALLGTAPPLQLLVERLATERAIDPDQVRRDQLPYREAAALAE